MSNEISQEKRDELILKIAEFLNFSSDEYLVKLMDDIPFDYVKGYLDAFLANAKEKDIRLLYQFVRTINMVQVSELII